MDDLLHVTPHPDEQRTYAELREEFRAANRERIHDNLLTHPLGWGVLGDPSKSRVRFTAEEWSLQMLFHLDAPVTQDFGLGDVPAKFIARIEAQVRAALEHDSVTWDDSVPGVVDHDAPPCCDVGAMSDDELCDYIDTAIKESAHG